MHLKKKEICKVIECCFYVTFCTLVSLLVDTCIVFASATYISRNTTLMHLVQLIWNPILKIVDKTALPSSNGILFVRIVSF